MKQPLQNASVLVAGAGLAGLAAARTLQFLGATPEVIEARTRPGGRVVTIRDGFLQGQHAEGGADLIEGNQSTLIGLIREMKLPTVRILSGGFGFYGTTKAGGRGYAAPSTLFQALGEAIHPLVHIYRLLEGRWDGALARELGRETVGEWLNRIDAPTWLRARVRALRGLFLADPEELSLLALVDFFADDVERGGGMRRIRGGNDRLVHAIADSLARRVELGAILRRVTQTQGGVRLTIEQGGALSERSADYLVITLPASTLREVIFNPPLPVAQQQAIARLRYGRATRTLLQFDRRFWKSVGRPRAF